MKASQPCPPLAPQTEWYSTWFDSPYYLKLYQERDQKEAQFFINNLIERLKISPPKTLLDLACGKGRHSIYLNQLGFDVWGLDLSEKNIQEARHFENDRLHFYEQDMREVLAENHFDYIFNLFTSFGYFEDDQENLLVLQAAYDSLKNGGHMVLDFLNPRKTIRELVPYQAIEREGICFHVYKSIENQYIIKDICFEDQGKAYHFQERVKALSQADFEAFFQKAGFTLKRIFGSYSLDSFNPEHSPRMIFFLEKS